MATLIRSIRQRFFRSRESEVCFIGMQTSYPCFHNAAHGDRFSKQTFRRKKDQSVKLNAELKTAAFLKTVLPPGRWIY